ncbi:hypothetical protein, partial [Pseudomonas rhodesiae]|uniref:hypothetical protein n=1 Tax=Pseudomonas rhodesiae TaxID=76760 RepID=UPI002B1D1385
AGGVKGLAPATVAGDATKFLRGDGTWQTATTDVDALNPIEVGFTNTASGCYSSAIGYCNGTTTINSVVGGRSNFTGTGIAA